MIAFFGENRSEFMCLIFVILADVCLGIDNINEVRIKVLFSVVYSTVVFSN